MLLKKEKFPNLFIWLLLLGVVIISLFINIFRVYPLKAPGIFDSDYGSKLDINFDIFEDGQFMENTVLPYSFSSSTKDKQIELVATLPDNELYNNSFIAIRTSGYSLNVEVDNNEIYDYSKVGVKDYGGGYWHFIKLPNNSSSKQINIKLFCPNDNPFAENINPIYIGSKGYLYSEAFSLTFESLIFGIVLIIFGILFLMNIVIFNRSIGNYFLLSLSLLLICFGVWVLFQSKAKQIIGVTNPAVPMELSFIAMCSLPFCIWFYISTNYKKIGEYKVLRYFAFAVLLIYVLITLLSFFGISYTRFLSFIGSLIIIYTILVLAYSIKGYKEGNKKLISCIIAIGSILISTIAEEILLLLRINIGHVSLLHSGMALAAITFIYQSIGNLIEKSNEENQAKLLKRLAYLDVVTLVENRNSYERFLAKEANEIDSYGIILADVNGLKMRNDMYGHKSGDDLLKKLTRELKDNLPTNSKLYRVGGDEFVGIIPSLSKEEFSTFVYKLRERFIPTEEDCGMAIGSHYYVKDKEECPKAAIEKADKNMYEHKELQKNLIHKNFLEKGFIRESSLMR